MESHDEKSRAVSLKTSTGGSEPSGLGGSFGRDTSVGDLFDRLLAEWKQDTQFLSSIHEMAISPAYQKIIGLGPVVLPFLFKELRERPDHWFWALKAITREDPVPEESRGNLPQMTEAWLNWAQSRGIAF
jgi:hypothetical protein